MADFIDADLTGSRFHEVDLTDARFEMVNLTRVTFRDAELDKVVMRGVELVDVDIHGEILNVTINGVEVIGQPWNGTVNETGLLHVRSALGTPVYDQIEIQAADMNGTWLAKTELPAEKASYGSFDQLFDLTEQQVKDIIENASKDPSRTPGSASSFTASSPS